MKTSRTVHYSNRVIDSNENETFFFPDPNEYDNLIRYAYAVDRENHMDLVHDSIVSTKNIREAKRFISGRKYSYMPSSERDITKELVTDQVCVKCNQVQPICEFERRVVGTLTYLRGECKNCRREYHRTRDREKRKISSKREKGLFCAKCDQVFSDEQIAGIKRPELKRKRTCLACKSQDLKKRHKEWRSKNADKLRYNRELNRDRNRESVRKWKKSNKRKVNSYARKYRAMNLEYRREYERKYRLKIKNELVVRPKARVNSNHKTKDYHELSI